MIEIISRSARQQQIRPQMQQPLKFEMLPQQQQQLLKQSQGSPKRDNRTLLSQSIIHQSYGVSQMNQSGMVGVAASDGNGSHHTGGGIITGSMSRQRNLISSGSNAVNCSANILPPHLSMAYYAQQAQVQPYFGEAIHPMQVSCIKALRCLQTMQYHALNILNFVYRSII